MKTIDTRFGRLEYDPEKVVTFPKGLLGFEDLRDFVIMPSIKNSPLFWIQSVEAPDVAFVLTDPSHFFQDYLVVPDQGERQILGIDAEDDCFCLVVVTVREDKTITMNLSAPVLFSPKVRKMCQVVLDNSSYSTCEPLPC